MATSMRAVIGDLPTELREYVFRVLVAGEERPVPYILLLVETNLREITIEERMAYVLSLIHI